MPEGREDPRTLGRYRLVRRLGQGAMGVVYLGEDPRLDRPVAIKTLQVGEIVDAAAAERLKERFLHEPRITAQLRHPNVVPVYDAGVDEESGIAWLALEHVEGRDLASLMTGPLPIERVVAIGRDVAAALDHAHARGIIHRDVKPANVLLDDDGRARLTDFGIAHEVEADRTKPGELLGSPAYMAPEQLGGGRLTPATDVHALAVLLYEALVGRRPFESSTNVTTAQAVLTAKPPPPSRVNDRLPRALDGVFRKAFSKAPAMRHASAGELAEGVATALASLAVASTDGSALDPDAATAVAVGGRGGSAWTRLQRGSLRSFATLRAAVAGARPRRRWLVAGLAGLVLAFGALVALVALPVRGGSGAESSEDLALAAGAAPGTTAASDEPSEDAAGPDGESQASTESDVAASRGDDGQANESEADDRAVRPRSEPAADASTRRSDDPVASRPPASPARRASMTRLVVDFYSGRDGTLTLSAGSRELLRARRDELRRMPARFRAFGKPRYRAEVDVPADQALTIRFEPDKDTAPLEHVTAWDLPAGGQALAAVEVGLRAKDLDVELLEVVR